MAFLIITQRHCLRAKVERLIREIYEQEYGAKIGAFPRVLLAAIDSQGEILCAAGFRDSDDGFFSEHYLDLPIEATLARVGGQSVARDRIFEFSTFASRRPTSIPQFLDDAINYAETTGYEWGFFTLTQSLRQILDRLGLKLRFLGSADACRLADALAWGSYYDEDPQVYAGNCESLTTRFSARRRCAVNA
jgi:hypothetical protein